MSAGFFWRIIATASAILAASPATLAAVPAQPVSATGPEASAVGRIVCRSNGRVEEASGWVVASADVVVTAAHLLFAAGRRVDPHHCVFRLHDADGAVREAARVEAIASPWQDERRRGDNSWDYAVLRLARPVAVRPLHLVARSWTAGEGRVQLASFPSAEDHRMRVTGGEARAFPLGAVHDDAAGLRVSEPSRLFASTALSAGGSSGGVYYVAGSQKIAGLHVGRICPGADQCFGFGIRIGADMLAAVADMTGRGASFAMAAPSPARR